MLSVAGLGVLLLFSHQSDGPAGGAAAVASFPSCGVRAETEAIENTAVEGDLSDAFGLRASIDSTDSLLVVNGQHDSMNIRKM